MRSRSRKDDPAPHLIIERGYWQDPTQVFAGLTWLIVGMCLGKFLL